MIRRIIILGCWGVAVPYAVSLWAIPQAGRAVALRVEPVPVSPADAASIPIAEGVR